MADEWEAYRRIDHTASCTHAGYQFQLRHSQVFEFFFFAMNLADRMDEARYRAAKALAGSSSDDRKQHWKRVEADPQPAFKKLRSFAAYQSEVIITRLVDNFLCFLSESMLACMTKRPELLRSSEQVRVDDVMRFSRKRELVDFLINRKLNSLSYGGLTGIEDFMRDRLGVEMTKTDAERRALSVAIELRNIYTHNRGIVNELFLGRIGDHGTKLEFEIGKRFHADFAEILLLTSNLFDIAARMDTTIREKFKLQAKRYKTWDAPRQERLATMTVPEAPFLADRPNNSSDSQAN